MKNAQVMFFMVIQMLIFNIVTQDPEEQQFAQFAQNLANFFPAQSFQFDLGVTQQQNLIFWPNPETEFIRGLFYITSTENGGLFVGCQSSGEMKKTFYNKKIGVFNVPYSGTGDMKIILKSQIHDISVYISYEFVLKKNKESVEKEGSQNGETSELQFIRQKFEKVQKSIFGQQAILQGIVKSEMADEQKLNNQVNSKSIKVILQTIVVIISGFISLYLLQKQLKSGYQLVI